MEHIKVRVPENKCSRHKHLYRPHHRVYNVRNIVLILIKNESGVGVGWAVRWVGGGGRSEASMESKLNIQC